MHQAGPKDSITATILQFPTAYRRSRRTAKKPTPLELPQGVARLRPIDYRPAADGSWEEFERGWAWGHPNGAAAVRQARALGLARGAYVGSLLKYKDFPKAQLPILMFDTGFSTVGVCPEGIV
ncbi:MAG TPA: hypothetical protein VGI79_16655 [Caulobacteraceae bacterium]|jgi:hypothetical protein